MSPVAVVVVAAAAAAENSSGAETEYAFEVSDANITDGSD